MAPVPSSEEFDMSTIETRELPSGELSGISGDALATIGRAAIAAIFILSGIAKISDTAGTLGYIESVGLPLAPIALGAAILIEVLGGVLLIAGYRPRLVAGILAVFSLVTAFAFHADLGDQNQFIHFFKNVALAGGLMQIIAFGGGKYAVHRSR